MGPRTVCCDLDGCLVDSTAPITASINHALTEAGLPARPADELAWCVGPPLLESLATLLEQAGADPARAGTLIDSYRAVYPGLAREQTRVIPGVRRVLEDLPDTVTLAVVTSKPAPFAGPILDATGLAELFAGLHAPATDELTEPKATTLGRALAAHQPDGRPDTAVMVGDRRHDIAAGRRAGTRTVGVTWGTGSAAELERAGADRVVTTPAELADALASDGRGPPRR